MKTYKGHLINDSESLCAQVNPLTRKSSFDSVQAPFKQRDGLKASVTVSYLPT